MILITRPFKKAKLLEQKLKKNKIVSHIDSLLSFHLRTRKYNFVYYTDYIVTSTQSVSSLKNNHRESLRLLRNKSFYVVGNEVSKELKKINITKIKKIFKNSADLHNYLKTKNLYKRKFCYLSGSVSNTLLLKKLKLLKLNFDRVILYTSKPKKNFSKSTINHFNQNKIKYVLLYSTYTLHVYLSLINKMKLKRKVQNVTHLCLSREIASIIKKEGFKKVLHSEVPTETSMLKSLYYYYKE